MTTDMRPITARLERLERQNHRMKLAAISVLVLAGAGPLWKKEEIVAGSGVKLTARGTGGNIRGLRHRQYRPDLLIGVSTHSKAEVNLAADQGADFVTFGPVYATPSKAAFGPPQGLEALADICRDSLLPVFALGGINQTRATEVRDAGASGIALISAIIASLDPRSSAEAFVTCG